MKNLQLSQKHKGDSEEQNKGTALAAAWPGYHLLLTCSEMPLLRPGLSASLSCWPS